MKSANPGGRLYSAIYQENNAVNLRTNTVTVLYVAKAQGLRYFTGCILLW